MAKDNDTLHLLESGAPIETKPKFDADTAKPAELLEAFKEKAAGLKLAPHKDMISGQFVDGGEGKRKFIVLIKKEAASADNLHKLGLSSKTQTMEVSSWTVPRSTMKSFDETMQADNADLQKAIHSKNDAKAPFTGLEFSVVSGDWDKGFTLSGVVGGSRSAVFGKDHGVGDPEKSKANIALVIPEQAMREALGDKKKAAPAAAAGNSEFSVGELDLGALKALAAAERAAPAEIREDTSGARRQTQSQDGKKSGLFGWLGRDRNTPKDPKGGQSQGGAAKG